MIGNQGEIHKEGMYHVICKVIYSFILYNTLEYFQSFNPQSLFLEAL